MEYQLTDSPYPPVGSGVERSFDKLHLTTVIDSILNKLGAGYKGGEFGDPGICMDLGFIWEHVLELAYKDRLGIRMGEVELDGIVGSPDGIGYDDPVYKLDGKLAWKGTGDPCLEEYKFKWKSSKNMPNNQAFERDIIQVKSYCYMLDLNIVIMRIGFINGNYSKGAGPMYRIARLVFDEEELWRNWEMIKGEAKTLMKEESNGRNS